MNTCILMVEIIKEPELRYTPDNVPLVEMLVEFPGLRAEEPPTSLKVVGWRNLAAEIKEQYHQGDRAIVVGRLGMNTIDRPEGFKEKRAELTASQIHKVGSDVDFGTGAIAEPLPGGLLASDAEDINNVVVPFEPRKQTAAPSREAEAGKSFGSQTPAPKFEPTPIQTPTTSSPNGGNDLDDIPF